MSSCCLVLPLFNLLHALNMANNIPTSEVLLLSPVIVIIVILMCSFTIVDVNVYVCV